MSKDMDLVMDAARASGADLPAASVAQSVLASNVPEKWRPGPVRHNPVCHRSRNEAEV
jgi:hypothetical protein